MLACNTKVRRLAVPVAVLALLGWVPHGGAQQFRPGAAPILEGWAEVVTATPRWLVIQDQRGREFPVAWDAIGRFFMRWPTTIDRISDSAMVEVTGLNQQSNRVLTNHVDVFEGGARSLVAPAMANINPLTGRSFNPIDFNINATAYGAPFPGLENPIQGGSLTGPTLLHVVGPIVSRVPLLIATQGNNPVMVVAPPGGLTMTQITEGSPSYVTPGDLLYFTAMEARPKSLILEQLVVYKRVPIDQFQP